ncbi:MAG: excinuclease subunit [Dehalococcoidales bacterium]|nr:excinuclease subunit [Dehalococcoidales bacterium]
MNKQYYVYIMTNKTNRVLYTGVTSDLNRRVYEHKNKLIEGFTTRYNVNKLVFYETCEHVEGAIAREKQIKGWLRRRKVDLIESMNQEWTDLSLDWTDCHSEGAKRLKNLVRRPFASLRVTGK